MALALGARNREFESLRYEIYLKIHHQYMHSKYVGEILPIVEKYVKNFIAKLENTDKI